jgi:hypothetical protein
MSPKDALEIAMGRLHIPRFTRRGSSFGPGQLVGSLPKEVREALASLRAEDISNLRWDDPGIWSNSYNPPPKRFSSRYFK